MASSLTDRLRRQVRSGVPPTPGEDPPPSAAPGTAEGIEPAAATPPGVPALRGRLEALFRASRARGEAEPAGAPTGFEPRLPGGAPAGRPETIRRGDVDHLALLVPAAPFEATRGVRGDEAALLAGDPALAGVDLGEAIYLDLETTGLSRGAGTVAFLVGWARFEGGRLAVHQRLLVKRRGEGEILRELDGELRKASALVTFNGKAFDRDLLAVRYAMARLDDEALLGLPHLDTLHPARRLMRGTLPSCDLRALERHLLGVRREHDVPGAQIPRVYQDFRRSGDPARIEAVVLHNAADLLSLVALPGALAGLVRAEEPGAVPGAVLFRAGRLHAERGDGGEALRLLAAASEAGDAGLDAREAAKERARLLRRAGRHEEARSEWSRLRASWPDDPSAYEEEAKDAEHRRRDPAAALAAVREYLSAAGGTGSAAVLEAFQRREARLLRRVDSRARR